MFQHVSILLLFGILVVLGQLGGAVARRLRLPALCGQIVVGILLGESFLGIVPAEEAASFHPFSMFALSLVAVTIGGHLEFRRLHNALRRIVLITVCQTTVTFVLVLVGLSLLNPLHLDPAHRLPLHLVLASIATSTSPVSTMHIIKEKVAKGILVKTTIAVIAINNLITITVFEILHSISAGMLTAEQDTAALLGSALVGESIAVGVGLGMGFLLVAYCRRLSDPHRAPTPTGRHARSVYQASMFTGFLVAMCLTAGICETITQKFGPHGVYPSAILANMVLGLVLANKSSFKEELLSLFGVLEHTMFVAFFVLAGSHLNLQTALHAGGAAVLLFALRFAGKYAGGALGARWAKASATTAHGIGTMLLAQGAVAIALVIILDQDPNFAPFREVITAVVLTAVVAAELASAPLIGWRLNRAGEAGQDRTRLIEFLQEEFIVTGLKARSKWDAIEQLCFFMSRVHRLPESPHQLIEAVKEREQSMSTAIGHGIAVPHARIAKGDRIYGVLALLDPPQDFEAPDGEPVRLVVMIATPEELADKHLEVIAAVTRMMRDRNIREAVFEANTPEALHEVIDSQEAGTFNYFIEA